MPEEPRYAIGDLADLGGVSRRTVRYYVQEGLLPAPFGVGRGNHYGPEHLDQLLRVKALQEAGRTLDEIRRALNGQEGADRRVRCGADGRIGPLRARSSGGASRSRRASSCTSPATCACRRRQA